ncbi:MAG: ABC transporter ATP-binding protein [Deltaproteobacteria bacterium]|nr:MAG: ABC transporter ATP-binding protein [Deltaproteobacteria bacterium]
MTVPLLEATGLHTYYGASHVLHGIDLRILPGECVTLMGRNGMGKTTTIRSLLGLTPPRAGEVRVRGKIVTGLPPHRIAQEGIALIPEGRGIFPTLTARENLTVAARPGRWTPEAVLDLFPSLRARLHHLGSQLSGGEQQMLSIGRALMTNPELVILDGATEGLAPLVRRQIWSVLRRLRAEGTATLVVDKEVRPLLELGDRHLILVKGRIAFAGDSQEWRARAEENLVLLRA